MSYEGTGQAASKPAHIYLQALFFIRDNWRGLMKISAIPVILYVAIPILSIPILYVVIIPLRQSTGNLALDKAVFYGGAAISFLLLCWLQMRWQLAVIRHSQSISIVQRESLVQYFPYFVGSLALHLLTWLPTLLYKAITFAVEWMAPQLAEYKAVTVFSYIGLRAIFLCASFYLQLRYILLPIRCLFAPFSTSFKQAFKDKVMRTAFGALFISVLIDAASKQFILKKFILIILSSRQVREWTWISLPILIHHGFFLIIALWFNIVAAFLYLRVTESKEAPAALDIPA